MSHVIEFVQEIDGFLYAVHTLSKGDVRQLYVDHDLSRKDQENLLIITKGSMTLEPKDKSFPDIVMTVGDSNINQPDFKAGVIYTSNCLEDIEYHCFSRKDKGRYQKRAYKMTAGHSLACKKGELVLVASGTTDKGDAPFVGRITQNSQILFLTDGHGLIVK